MNKIMGRKKKVMNFRRNENSIRECDVILLWDPSQGEENLKALPKIGNSSLKLQCPSNFTWCRLGCVCESLNAKNLDDNNKHCRDTGFAECIFGCVCGNLQDAHKLQTYKQLTFGVDKTKKLKWQDDDECGFIPPGTALNLEDGRPKRKSQPPERFRHDVGGEKGERGRKSKAKESNERKNGRPRRHSGDKNPLPIRRRRRFVRSCSSNVQNYSENNDQTSDGTVRNRPKQPNSEISSPRTDLPKKVYPAAKSNSAATNGEISTVVKPATSQEATAPPPFIVYGKPLSVVELQHANDVIFMVVRVIDGKNKIISFVEWTKNINFRPTVSFMGNFLHSEKIKDQNDCSTIMRLPFEDSNSIGWYFYDIPEDYTTSGFIMFPNLHAIIGTTLLQNKIETFKPKEEGEIQIISISDINSNKHEKKELEGSVFLLLEYDGAIVMGTSPPFYTKIKAETLYVPGENSSDNLSSGECSPGGSLGSISNISSEAGSESERCNSSDQTDADESDSEVKIS